MKYTHYVVYSVLNNLIPLFFGFCSGFLELFPERNIFNIFLTILKDSLKKCFICSTHRHTEYSNF